MSEITREELVEKLARGENFVLLDVLPSAYFRHSHLPGAVNLPIDEIPSRISQIVFDKGQLIVVYCLNLSCPTAQNAVQLLLQLGYENVREYSGGKDDWRAAGLRLNGESRILRQV